MNTKFKKKKKRSGGRKRRDCFDSAVVFSQNGSGERRGDAAFAKIVFIYHKRRS